MPNLREEIHTARNALGFLRDAFEQMTSTLASSRSEKVL